MPPSSSSPVTAAEVDRLKKMIREVPDRIVAGYGLPEWLRVTVGLPEENARFLRELPGALAGAAASAKP